MSKSPVSSRPAIHQELGISLREIDRAARILRFQTEDGGDTIGSGEERWLSVLVECPRSVGSCHVLMCPHIVAQHGGKSVEDDEFGAVGKGIGTESMIKIGERVACLDRSAELGAHEGGEVSLNLIGEDSARGGALVFEGPINSVGGCVNERVAVSETTDHSGGFETYLPYVPLVFPGLDSIGTTYPAQRSRREYKETAGFPLSDFQ